MQVRRVRLQIETDRQRIIGTLQLPTEGYRSRTTDFLNAHEVGFIALTEVELNPHDGGPASLHSYAAVGCRHIVAIAEIEDLGTYEEDLLPPIARGAGPRSVPPPVD